jgi:hypothetical protein
MIIKGGIPVGGNLAYSDLLYRGEPYQMLPMPYYGGEIGVQQLSQNIPVGQDPIFPMDQDQFSDYVRYQLDKKKPLPRPGAGSPGPQLPGFVNRGVRSASVPGGFDAKYVS